MNRGVAAGVIVGVALAAASPALAKKKAADLLSISELRTSKL